MYGPLPREPHLATEGKQSNRADVPLDFPLLITTLKSFLCELNKMIAYLAQKCVNYQIIFNGNFQLKTRLNI